MLKYLLVVCPENIPAPAVPQEAYSLGFLPRANLGFKRGPAVCGAEGLVTSVLCRLGTPRSLQVGGRPAACRPSCESRETEAAALVR